MDYNIIQGHASLTNSGDNFSGTLSVSHPSYVNKGIYLLKAPIANTTTTPTINLNSLGATTIVTRSGGALSVGQLTANGWYLFMYESGTSKFHLLTA